MFPRFIQIVLELDDYVAILCISKARLDALPERYLENDPFGAEAHGVDGLPGLWVFIKQPDEKRLQELFLRRLVVGLAHNSQVLRGVFLSCIHYPTMAWIERRSRSVGRG